MKKLFAILSFLIISPIFAVTFPTLLYGIWEGKDRIVFFEENENSTSEIVIILKEYYGWYYDRAVEPKNYNEKEVRTRNSATTRNAENVIIEDFKSTYEKENVLAGEMKIKFSNRQYNSVPFVIIDENLYLDFLQCTTENDLLMTDTNDSNNFQNTQKYTFYKGNATSKGFLVSEQLIPENIPGFLFDGEKYFDIRYWKSDMEYETESAKLLWQGVEYYVPKHIFSGENNYSCVSGRSKKIRNVVEPFLYSKDDFYFTEDKQILVRDKEPYLTKVVDKSTFEDLMQIIKNANLRRKPDSPPIFPPNDVNWHWDMIDYLESNNELIQAVRERQKAFGPRAKDAN